MPILDKRFALVRDGQYWYAARVGGSASPTTPTFRIRRSVSAESYREAIQTLSVERVARAVLIQGFRAHFAVEGTHPSPIGLRSARVSGWRLDPAIAKKLGVAESKDF